jgi:stage II sporulation protein M
MKSNIKRQNFIDNFIDIWWNFVKSFCIEHAIILVAMIAFFVLSIIVGAIGPKQMQQQVMSELLDKISDILTPHEGLLFLRILWNNLVVEILLLLLGITIIGSVAILFMNGLMLGIVFSLEGRLFVFLPNKLQFWVSLIPHGIFEIPAIVFSGALGLIIGVKFLFSPWYKKNKTRRKILRECLQAFVYVAVPMIILAAVVETFVTPVLVDLTKSETAAHELPRSYLIDNSVLAHLNVSEKKIAAKEGDVALEDRRVKKVLISLLFNDTVFDFYKDIANTPTVGRVWVNNETRVRVSIILHEFGNNTEEEVAAKARTESSVLAYMLDLQEYSPEFGNRTILRWENKTQFVIVTHVNKFIIESSSMNLSIEDHNEIVDEEVVFLQRISNNTIKK